MSIRVSIVEDDAGVSNCLRTFVESASGFRCVNSFSTGESAIKGLVKDYPDVALIDIGLPGINGIEVIRQLKRQLPGLKILMWTVYEDDDQIFAALEAGADGYLLKRSLPEEILKALTEVQRGGGPLTGIIARKLIRHFQKKAAKGAPAVEALSPREREILDLLAKGKLYKEIADTLSISYETVHTHVRKIYEKLHVHTRTEAVTKYLKGE